MVLCISDGDITTLCGLIDSECQSIRADLATDQLNTDLMARCIRLMELKQRILDNVETAIAEAEQRVIQSYYDADPEPGKPKRGKKRAK